MLHQTRSTGTVAAERTVLSYIIWGNENEHKQSKTVGEILRRWYSGMALREFHLLDAN